METKLISAETKAKISDFCLHYLKQISGKQYVPLYHYTNGSSLIKIVNSGSLWATQVSCLNDAKEIAYAADLLRAEVKSELTKELSKDERLILEILDEALKELHPSSAGAFVACFSARKNDLSQWRAYGNGESSFSIEFDPLAIAAATSFSNAFLVPCEYDPENQKTFVSDIVIWAKNFFTEAYNRQPNKARSGWATEFGHYFLWQLSFLAPFFKHPAFKDEDEWRLVAWLRPEDVSKLCFVERQSMISRHLPLYFSDKDKNGCCRLPIKGVLVGPSRHKEISKIGVGDLLSSKGYAPEVDVTDIPFRTI